MKSSLPARVCRLLSVAAGLGALAVAFLLATREAGPPAVDPLALGPPGARPLDPAAPAGRPSPADRAEFLSDACAALEESESQDVAANRAQAEAFARSLAPSEFRALLSWASASPLTEHRAMLCDVLLAGWLDVAPVEAARHVARHPFDHLSAALARRVAGTLLDAAPETAAGFVLTLPASDLREQLLPAVLRSWAERDWIAASRWCGELAGAAQEMALRHLVSDWVERDVAGFAELLSSLPAGHALARATAARTLAQRDPFAAATWARRQPSGPDRDEADAAVAVVLAGQAPLPALRYAEQLESDAGRIRALLAVIETWAAREPRGAADWVAAQPETVTQRRAITVAVRRWAQADLDGAARWVLAQPAGASRDLAMAALCDELGRDARDGAVAFARAIADPALRTRALHQFGQ